MAKNGKGSERKRRGGRKAGRRAPVAPEMPLDPPAPAIDPAKLTELEPQKRKRGRPRNRNTSPDQLVLGDILPLTTPETVEDVAAMEAGKPHAGGRPTKYRPELAAAARMLCRNGATDYELAVEFGVHTATIYRWAGRYSEFCEALKVGKDDYDERVKRAIAMRACGYSFHATKIMQYEGDPVRVEYVEHVPPDMGAAKLWMANRQGWKDKAEVDVPPDSNLAQAMAVTAGAIEALVNAGRRTEEGSGE